MQYRGFNIFTSVPTVIERWSKITRTMEPHIGVHCEIYDVHDTDHAECLDTFQLLIDQDIPNLHEESIEKAIRNHVDSNVMRLDLCRNEVLVERKNALIGELASRLGMTLQADELYDLLSENVGMTDDEIRACGFQSLASHFDRGAYAQTIAEHMIQVGTEYTTTGNWHFDFDTIRARFGVDLTRDAEMVSLIEDALYDKGEILSQIDIYDNEFDLMFYLNYCPYSDRDDPVYQIEDNTQWAVTETQEVTAPEDARGDNMAHGKMKTLHGLYKRIGREAFMETARHYSNHVHGSVETTIGEMESRWYDAEHTLTEAEKMVKDFNDGMLRGWHTASHTEENQTQPDHPKLIGYFDGGSVELNSVQDVAEFICREGIHGDLTIQTENGDFFLNTFGTFIDRIADMDYRQQLLEVLVPMQMELEASIQNDTM